jgi:hypothetical protein
MSFIDVVRTVHIAAGTVSLLTFAIPMVAAKGGRVHRRAGWVFVTAMGLISLTAVASCLYRLGVEGDPRRQATAVFLAYVSILSAASTSLGVRSLRNKRRTGAHRHPWDVGLPALLVIAALAVAAYGLTRGQALLVGFAPVGLFVGISQLRYWLRPPGTRMHWWFEHMGGMVGASIGALTAFLVVNAPRLGLRSGSLLVWLLPSLVGAVGLSHWTARYRRQFAGGPRVESRAA